MLCSCAGPKTGFSATPAGTEITADENGKAEVKLDFNFPARYVPTRARVFVTPELVQGDSVIQTLDPMVVDGPTLVKIKTRRLVLHGEVDPQLATSLKPLTTKTPLSYPYSATLQLPEGFTEGNLFAVVSSDGCGVCTGRERVEIARVLPMPVPPEPPFTLGWITPKFVVKEKVREGKGTANMQFVINRYEIKMDLANNRRELTAMLDSIRPILQDSLATLTSLSIYGMASADGSLPFNTTLSYNRANSAKNWLVGELGMTPAQQRIIEVGSRPEGWAPVLAAMEADNHPGADDIRAILDKYAAYNDDVAERYIRKSKWWPDIREKYLQKDRKVDYTYTYKIKSFTNDPEMLEIYKTRPDAFNEEEFLHVADLAADDASKIQVYRNLLHYFPESRTAKNNLAVLLYRNGEKEEARKIESELNAD